MSPAEKKIRRVVIEYEDALPVYLEGGEIDRMLAAEAALLELERALGIARRLQAIRGATP